MPSSESFRATPVGGFEVKTQLIYKGWCKRHDLDSRQRPVTGWIPEMPVTTNHVQEFTIYFPSKEMKHFSIYTTMPFD